LDRARAAVEEELEPRSNLEIAVRRDALNNMRAAAGV
jgi:hypothetical protein